MSIAFLVTTLIVVAIPGTGVIYTLSAGISQGSKASVIAATGCTLGIVPHMLATVTGIAVLLHTSALAFQIVKYLGVAYLLYMAWAMLRDEDAVALDHLTPHSAVRVIISGILINILNPKLTLFFFAFLPQFVSPDDPNLVGRMLGLSAVFMLLTFAMFIVYGLCAASVRNQVISRPGALSWMRRIFAASFIALGARLLFTS
ncbi:LysE family translocator [Pseudonocardia spinosispora]|uniref:LysE family translocator n=1 Tax=Pseudonocardia spinosispora TaxID=103441 RepID=UPI00040AE1A8|nr:LysE family translocator [Pseudonocardia spinosispora]